MLWDAFLVEPRTRERRPLGRVRAKLNPEAWLRAQKKFKVSPADQPRLGIRAVREDPAIARRLKNAAKARAAIAAAPSE